MSLLWIIEDLTIEMMGRKMYMKHVEDDREDIIGYHQGCLSGVIHVFDYHQWNYIRRITHKNHKGGRRSSDGKGNIPRNLLQNQELELEQLFGGGERQYLGARSSPSANKRTLKSRIKEFSKLRKCKKQDSGFSPRQPLQRTYSLHHLEPSDRRLDEIWKQKKSEIVFLPSTLDSKMGSLGLPRLNKLEGDADVCEDVERGKELIQEIVGIGDDGTMIYLDELPKFSIKARFTKSGSFPTPDMSRKMNVSPSKLENKINESWVSSEGGVQSGKNIQKNKKHFRAKSWNVTSDSEEMSIDRKLGEAFQSLKAVSKEDEKNKGVDHQKESQPTIHHEGPDKDEASTNVFPLTVLDEHPRERDDEKDSKFGIEVDENSDIRRDFIHRKSYSLNDSLERYSRLVEFTSRPDIELQSSKSLKLRNEYDPPTTRNVSFTRIYSLSHLDSFYSIQKDEQGNAQLASLPLDTVPENGSLVEEDTNAEEIQNEAVEMMGDEGSLEGERSMYIGDLEESIDNRKMTRIKEEDAHCSETTNEFISLPIQGSNAETSEGKNLENANEEDSDLYYARELLARSSFCKDITSEMWLSAEHPSMDEYIFEEMEADWHQELENETEDSMHGQCTHHQILFDVVNQAIVSLHDRASLWYPKILSSSCRVHQMPIGRRIDEEIMAITSSFLSRKAKQNQSVDDIVYGDMERDDKWMKLNSENECLAMELEDLIVDELLDELLFGELLDELHV